MNRNQNSHFSKNPQVDIQRSRFDRSHSVKLSGNVGDLIPFYCDEVLPGDTFQIDTSKLIRLQTLVTPVMDNIYLDTYYFFVPCRLVWEHWREMMGENTSAPWFPEVEYSVPQVTSPVRSGSGSEFGWAEGTIADYMGIPPYIGNLSVSALPFRAYALIWNEWFRDENLQTPQSVPVGDDVTVGSNDSSGLFQAVKGGYPLKAGKFRDYFTSCLPSPQKGPDVLLPLGDYAPVVSRGVKLVPSSSFTDEGVVNNVLKFYDLNKGINKESGEFQLASAGGVNLSSGASLSANTVAGTDAQILAPANLWTNLTQATAATINQLRLAFQIQRIYEKDARGGTRYIEILSNHFGVTSPDSRLQRPEYLGGNRMLINVNQVVQNSESATTPQGTTTAYSLTVDTHSDFTQSFVEHGFLIGLCVARYDHTYQCGIERFFSRKTRFDYYWPSLANIGEQPVYNREIFADGTVVDDGVFGYQEAWADYRYKPNRVCAEMRSISKKSLDAWNLADDYAELPKLSPEWIVEDKTNVDRALAVTSSVANQFFGDFYIKNLCTRPMPVFSIPGLIDHH
jgi:hypothetical protein